MYDNPHIDREQFWPSEYTDDEKDDMYWSAGCDEYHRREEDRLIEESEAQDE